MADPIRPCPVCDARFCEHTERQAVAHALAIAPPPPADRHKELRERIAAWKRRYFEGSLADHAATEKELFDVLDDCARALAEQPAGEDTA